MTKPLAENPSSSTAKSSPAVSPPSHASKLHSRSQLIACLILTSGVLCYLLWTPDGGDSSAKSSSEQAINETVRLAGPKCISVDPGCPLCRKLHVAAVESVALTSPTLTVTGVVAASLRPGQGKSSDYWQFNSPELLTTFTDWQKATADIAFTETQLAQTRQLADARVNAQQKLVDRMKKLVAIGTDTQKDLAAAEADLIQFQLQGRKDVHEAETAVRLARRTEAAMARQLQQAGLEPDLLKSTTSDLDIVMADVPEGVMSRVKIGQGCEARFFGFPDSTFHGRVRAIAPVLSKERRSLRVLFAINDPKDQLRPGMFSDIGLGTDVRQALLIPAEGIVHVGRSDYVLVHHGLSDWRVTEVQVGELHDSGMEILAGLHAGQQIAGQGAILLKPLIIEALLPSTHPERRQAVRLPQRSEGRPS
jgi:membrane fusion protein, heavy metal efflux system